MSRASYSFRGVYCIQRHVICTLCRAALNHMWIKILFFISQRVTSFVFCSVTLSGKINFTCDTHLNIRITGKTAAWISI